MVRVIAAGIQSLVRGVQDALFLALEQAADAALLRLLWNEISFAVNRLMHNGSIGGAN